MAKEIIPHKLIVTLNEDWTVQSSILSYRLREDGKMEANKYFTIGVDAGIDAKKVAEIIDSTKTHSNKGEKIDEEK